MILNFLNYNKKAPLKIGVLLLNTFLDVPINLLMRQVTEE